MKHLLIALMVSLLMAACGDDGEYCYCDDPPEYHNLELSETREFTDNSTGITNVTAVYTYEGKIMLAYECFTGPGKCEWKRPY
jgi:uncharacterized lipoprotein YehR (DUF1307 family)